MRRRTTFLIAGGLLLLAGCTRTIIVREPAPDTDRRGSRPPPRSYPEPQTPDEPPPPPRNTAATLGIPPGHLPDPGECRVWIPGTPPGQQPRPRSRPCAGILAVAPAGSWIVYRPTDDRRVVHVRLVDERRAGLIIRIRIFDIATERLVREEMPQEQPPPQDDRGRDERPRPRDDATTLGVPPGHLPDPGECRVWIPGMPPGRQPQPRSRPCEGIAATAPAGSWIVYRPTDDRRLVYVRLVDERRPGVVIRIRIFDIATERLVREETPPDDNRPFNQRPDIQPPIETRPPEQQRPPVQPPPANRPPEQQQPPVQPPPGNKPPEQQPPPVQPPPENKPPEQPRGPSTAATLDVPPGHLPDVGECRVWIPGTAPGQQPRPKSRPCTGISAVAPAGSWIIYRPSEDQKVVQVRIVDPRRRGVVIRIQIFDMDTKQLLREANP